MNVFALAMLIPKLQKMGAIGGSKSDLGFFVHHIVEQFYPQASSSEKRYLRRILTGALREKPEEKEAQLSPEEIKKKMKERNKAIKKEAKERTVGMMPRLARELGNTVGGVVDTLGATGVAAMQAPMNMMAGAAQGMQNTMGESFLGVPNMGNAISAVAQNMTLPSQTALSGFAHTGANLARGVGNDALAKATEQKMQENQMRTTADMMSSNITPSQARYYERVLSANNNALKNAMNSPWTQASNY